MSRLFTTGVPVVGRDMIGREDEKKRIKRLLKSGQSVIISGPRRMGKTSLALTVLAELKKEGYFTGHADVFEMATQAIFAQRILETTLNNKKLDKAVKILRESVSQAFSNIEFKHVIEDFEWILKFSEKNNKDFDLLGNAFDFPENFSKKHKIQMFMFYDEIGDIEKFNGEDIVKLMRSKLQLHSNVTYLFAGSHQSVIDNIFIKHSGPFYRYGQIFLLSFIDSQSLKRYVKMRFDSVGILINDDALDELIRITKGHPYYIQLICREAYFYSLDMNVQIGVEVIQNAFEEALQIEEMYLSKLWGELSRNSSQIQVLHTLTSQKDRVFQNDIENKINVYRTINTLVQKGILRKEERGVYEFQDPLLKEYMRRIFC